VRDDRAPQDPQHAHPPRHRKDDGNVGAIRSALPTCV
jgi:hypothetical protein